MPSRGEFVSFLGPSGCGKTTTLRMIAGFEKPTAGTIVVDGTDITYRAPNQRNVGMVFQSYALFPNMTVADNIGFGLKVRKRPKAEITKRVGELLELIHLAGRGRPLPVPAVGRPAAARRPRPGARHRAPGPAPRRAAVGARRQDPDRPAQGDPGDPAPARDHHGLRHPRPGGGALAVRPGRGHERRAGSSRSARRPRSTTSRRRRSWPRSSGTLNLVDGRVIDPGAGRLSVDGQEVRTSKAVTDVGPNGLVTLALRPEGIELGDGRAGCEPAARHRRGHQLPRFDRADPGQGR